MYIVHAIPLNRIPVTSSQVFAYFSFEKLEKGSIAIIKIGKREAAAIIIDCIEAEKEKYAIKKSSFKLKKIKKMLCPSPIIDRNQWNLISFMHENYLASLGSITKLFIPNNLLKRKKQFNFNAVSKKKVSLKKPCKPILLWKKDRKDEYIKKIREALKQEKQILFLVPNQVKLEFWQNILKKDFQDRIILFHANLKTSSFLKSWEDIRNGRSGIILGTRKSVFAPFSSLSLLIIEQEENTAFISWDQYPRYDARVIAKQLAKNFKADIILGSDFPNALAYMQAKQGKFSLVFEKNHEKKIRTEIIDMKEEIKKQNFSFFSDKLEEELENTLEKKQQAIIFVTRRGISSGISCRDCGMVIKCEDCDAPMAFHDINRKKTLICHHCGKTRPPPNSCPKCKSWRIKYFGIGTQKVARALLKKRSFKKARIAILDSDSSPNLKEQKKIISEFENHEIDILISTSLVFKFSLLKNIELAVLLLIDPLLHIPDFRSSLKSFRILQKLNSLANILIVQTYNEKLEIFNFWKEQELKGFLNKELEERKALDYPPFSEILRCSFSNRLDKIAKKQAVELKNVFQKAFLQEKNINIIGPIPRAIPKIKSKYFWQIITKIKGSSTEKKEIKRKILLLLPKKVEIEINPLNS